MIADYIKWDNITRSTWCKEDLVMNILPEKQKIAPLSKKIFKNKPRVGQGRAGIRCKETLTH